MFKHNFRTFPEGLDIQGASLEAFKWFDKHQKEEREHPFVQFDHNKQIRDQFEKEGFKILDLLNPQNISTIKMSIDTEEDLEECEGNL